MTGPDPAAPRPLIVVEPSRGDRGSGRPRLEVGPGEIAVLTGPAGSGKSALLASAAGRRSATGCRVEVAGELLSSLSPRARRKAARAVRLFYMTADPALISNLTVMENLLLPVRYLGGRDETGAAREAMDRLEAVGLAEAAGWLPARLTGEGRKRVALIRGLLRNPLVALLDDPFSDLEEGGAAAVMPFLRAALRRGGCAILAAARDPAPYGELEPATVEIEGILHRENSGTGDPS